MAIFGTGVTILGSCLAALTALAAWRFLDHAAWGRTTLEILSWLNLIYFGTVGIFWVGSALYGWSEFKTEATTELPTIAAISSWGSSR